MRDARVYVKSRHAVRHDVTCDKRRSVVTGGAPWERLAALIEGRVRDGTYQPGAKLPTLEEWKADGYSQTPVLKAYRVLTERGLIVSVRGDGVYVVDAPPPAALSLEERVAALEAWRVEVEGRGSGAATAVAVRYLEEAGQ